MKRRIVQLIALLPAAYVLLFLWYQHVAMPYTLVDLGPVGSLHGRQVSPNNTPTAQTVQPDRPATKRNQKKVSSAGFDNAFHPQLHRYINAAGQVAWSEYRGSRANLSIHTFFSSQGQTLDLGSLGGKVSLVTGLSASGHVIGSSYIGTKVREQHAFLWKEGRMQDLGTLPGGRFSYALALNDRDQVVGKAQSQTGDFHAFFWSAGEMTDLGVLPHGTESFASALNNKGQVVGWATTPNGTDHAVVWDQGKIEDLNCLVHQPGDLCQRRWYNPQNAEVKFPTSRQ